MYSADRAIFFVVARQAFGPTAENSFFANTSALEDEMATKNHLHTLSPGIERTPFADAAVKRSASAERTPYRAGHCMDCRCKGRQQQRNKLHRHR